METATLPRPLVRSYSNEIHQRLLWKDVEVAFENITHTVRFIDDTSPLDTTDPDVGKLGQALSYVRDIPTRRKLVRGLLALRHAVDAGSYVVATARRAYTLVLLLARALELDDRFMSHIVSDISLSAIDLREWAGGAKKLILFDDTIIAGRNYGRNTRYLDSIFDKDLECWIFLDWRGTSVVSELGMDLHYDLAQAFAAQGLPYHTDYPRTRPVLLDDVSRLVLAGAAPLNDSGPGASVLDRDWITFDVTNKCMDGLGVANLTLLPSDALLATFSSLVIDKLGDELGKQVLGKIVIAKVRAMVTSDFTRDAVSFVPVLLVSELPHETLPKILGRLGCDARADRNQGALKDQESMAVENRKRLHRTEAALATYTLSSMFMAVVGRSLVEKGILRDPEEKEGTPEGLEAGNWLVDDEVAMTSIGREMASRVAGLASWAWGKPACEPVIVEGALQRELTKEDEQFLRLTRRDVIPCPDEQLSRPIYEYIRSVNSIVEANRKDLTLGKIAEAVKCSPMMASMGIDVLNDAGLCKPKWEADEAETRGEAPCTWRYFDRAEATQYAPYHSLSAGPFGGRLSSFAEEPPDVLTDYTQWAQV